MMQTDIEMLASREKRVGRQPFVVNKRTAISENGAPKNKIRIGVFLNMKYGIEQFVYRELQFLSAQGFALSLFPTWCKPGLYNPPPDWRLHPWNAVLVVLLQPYFFLRAPLRYSRLLWEAIGLKAISCCFQL